MAYNDWDKFMEGNRWVPYNAEGQILDYTGSTGIPAPTSSLGTQGRTFRIFGTTNIPNHIYYQVSSSVSSSMFNPILSSRAYSVSTWVRLDQLGGSIVGSGNFIGCGLSIKSRSAGVSSTNYSIKHSNLSDLGVGYRLLLTTDGINSTNPGDGNLRLKLCGSKWTGGSAVLCSGSYSPGNWYRIKLELFEKANVPSIKTDELYAYLYNTGSQSWEEVGHLSIDSLTGDYISWGGTNNRVGIVHGASGNYSVDVLFSYDGFEISQVPWDRNNPG